MRSCRTDVRIRFYYGSFYVFHQQIKSLSAAIFIQIWLRFTSLFHLFLIQFRDLIQKLTIRLKINKAAHMIPLLTGQIYIFIAIDLFIFNFYDALDESTYTSNLHKSIYLEPLIKGRFTTENRFSVLFSTTNLFSVPVKKISVLFSACIWI